MKAFIGSSGKLLFLWQTEKLCSIAIGNILYMFDYCADPVVHLLQLKSSMAKLKRKYYFLNRNHFNATTAKTNDKSYWSDENNYIFEKLLL